ncbi:hypothetical protein TWF696_000856 [Orbilia brochopaga]|uniref:Uncharacterized protein n=1 Tax=Orbilia brochopaga TaxID=3140254 RepID=A0AAV9VF97_9PEZI
MGSSLSIINDTPQTVTIYVFLSGFRTININNSGDIPIPLKANYLSSGWKIKYGLGKVWYDVDVVAGRTLHSQRGIYLGGDKTIVLSTWLRRWAVDGSIGALELGVTKAEIPNERAQLTGGDDERDPKEPPESPTLLTRDWLIETLARSTKADGGSRKVYDAFQTFVDAGITVETGKAKEGELAPGRHLGAKL